MMAKLIVVIDSMEYQTAIKNDNFNENIKLGKCSIIANGKKTCKMVCTPGLQWCENMCTFG